MTTFRLATFVNDKDQYGEMRQSFEAAGFAPPLARFTVEKGNPYAGINRLARADEPYVLLVHQDVRCNQGDTAGSLQARLAELSDDDPGWVVAGNAGWEPQSGPRGSRRTLNPIRNVSDPHGTSWAGGLPKRVVILDENMLILRTERGPICSQGLSGWHLYGADVALNATLAGGSAYVIDFRVTHLSAGSPGGYGECMRRFVEHWRSPPATRGGDPEASVMLESVLAELTRDRSRGGRG